MLPTTVEFGWKIDAPAGVLASAVGVGGVVVVSTISADGATIVTGYEGETGTVAWQRSIDADRTVTLVPVGDAITMLSVEKNVDATLSRLDPTDGSVVWEVSVNPQPGARLRNQLGSLVRFDSETERLNVFDPATGDVAIELETFLAANSGFVVRNGDMAQIVDFQTLESVGPAVVIPDLHDSTRTLGVVVGERFVQYIDKSFVAFDLEGNEIGRSAEILNAAGMVPVAYSDSLVIFQENGLTNVIDVADNPQLTWSSSDFPQVVGASRGRVIAVTSSLPPEGGSRTAVVDLHGGSDICEISTDQTAQVFGNGLFADATAFDLNCNPLWTIELPAEQTAVALENGALVFGVESTPSAWYFYRG